MSVEGPSTGERTDDKGSAVQDALKNRAALVVAALAFAVFLIVVFLMWGKADDTGNETAWARYTFLLAGVEAIAFAGVGWLFGREVSRATVETAKEQTREAQSTAEEKTRQAASAQATAHTLLNSVEAKLAPAGPVEQMAEQGVEAPAIARAQLEEIAETARKSLS
jgi:hypothetical protein